MAVVDRPAVASLEFSMDSHFPADMQDADDAPPTIARTRSPASRQGTE
jgi:hypothetical protein